MTDPRTLAVGTAVPITAFDQETVAGIFGYSDAVRRNFFLRSGIERRHFFVDPSQTRPDENINQLAMRFEAGSVALAAEAIRTCLKRTGVNVLSVDFLATTTCTGRMCPSIDAHLIRALGFRENVQRVHVGDTGCASAVVAMQQADNYLRAFPGRRALVVAVEVCSATYAVDDSLGTAVANAIFADGAAAALLATDGSGPAIVAHQTLIRSEYLDRMGFTFPDGRYQVRLSSEVRHIAPAMMETLAVKLLNDHGLAKRDVRFWVLHSAGRRVIERVQEALGLADDNLRFSRTVLRNYGNMSSATVLFVLDQVVQRGEPRPGDWAVMIALGPGFAAEAALLRW